MRIEKTTAVRAANYVGELRFESLSAPQRGSLCAAIRTNPRAPRGFSGVVQERRHSCRPESHASAKACLPERRRQADKNVGAPLLVAPPRRAVVYFSSASWNSFQSSRLFKLTASRGALASSGRPLAERIDRRVSSSWS